MKILITGATGFVGSHVADILSSKGYDIRCIVRKTSNLRWVENKNYELMEASLNDADSLVEAVKGVDYVYHIAGLISAKNLEGYMKGNRDATRNLLNVVKKHSPNIKRFLYMSSQTASGPAKSLDKPIDETMPCNPITSYGKSKKAGEEVAKEYMKDLPITIVRAPAVYGPRDTATFSIFKAVKSGLGTFIGFKPKYVSLIHSKDLASGIIQATESDNTIGETYFISSEEFYTWDKLIPLMAKIMNKKHIIKLRLPHSIVLAAGAVTELFGKFSSKPPVFNYEKGIDFIQDYWICSVNKAKSDFNYKQNISVEAGFEDTINWYKQNKWF